MGVLEPFNIDLKGLKEGETSFEFDIDGAFFKALEESELQEGKLHSKVSVYRTDDFFELNFHTEGTVVVQCDLCLDDMEQTICTDNRLVAKFGEIYSEDDDLVTVVEDEGILDIAWFIYEFIELSIPVRHVHAPGKCNIAMIKMLEEHSTTTRSSEEDDEVDPRWAALLKLKK